MNDTWRFVITFLLVLVLGALLPLVADARGERGHHGDCSRITGIKQAHCERHEWMYGKCHAIRGEAHHECDRQSILANPLDCAKLSGADVEACRAELEATKNCEDRRGSEFFRCMREALVADPRH
jgi:hypothetical protein